jgi:glycosyltransferase involved in cell wall biosynthesis
MVDVDQPPIRVLELLTSTAVGGGPKHVYDLATRLPRAHFTPLVAAPRDGSYFDQFLRAEIPTTELALNRLRPGTLSKLIALIRTQRADLVHSHGKGAGLYGRLAAAIAHVPAVHTLHGIHYLQYALGTGALYLMLERVLARWTQVIINVSESQLREGAALRLFRPDRGVVVPNGIDIPEVDGIIGQEAVTRESLGLSDDHLVIGCVTRFDQVKAVGTLLEVTRRLRAAFPALHLVLVGGGGEERLLRAEVTRRQLQPHVTFLNFVPRAVRILPTFTLYISASYREGLPLAVLEAMAAGLPVVATRVGGHIDAVEDGVTGLLAEPGDPAALAEKTADLLANHGLRRSMGEAARRRSERLFSIDRMVADTAGIYRGVVGARSPAGELAHGVWPASRA